MSQHRDRPGCPRAVRGGDAPGQVQKAQTGFPVLPLQAGWSGVKNAEFRCLCTALSPWPNLWHGIVQDRPRNHGMGLPRLTPSLLVSKQTYCSKNTIALAQSGPGWRPPPWQAGCRLIPSRLVLSCRGTRGSLLVMCSGALLSACWRQEEILRAGVENKMKVVGLGFFFTSSCRRDSMDVRAQEEIRQLGFPGGTVAASK